MNLTKNCINIKEERIIELIDRSKLIKEEVIKDCYRCIKKTYPAYGTKGKMEKAISIYKKIYKENLNDDEKTILILYVIINDDKELTKDFIRTKGNFENIGKKYDVNKNFVQLRWIIKQKISKYKNEIKILKLQKENNND